MTLPSNKHTNLLMLNFILVKDQTPTGIEFNRVELSFQTPVVTVAQLLRKRMQVEQQRCEDTNETEPLPYFHENGFYIKVGDRRVEDIDQEVVLIGDDSVAFVENTELSKIFSLN